MPQNLSLEVLLFDECTLIRFDILTCYAQHAAPHPAIAPTNLVCVFVIYSAIRWQ
eukprot:m.726881 g.726881  ORF g.726881 m.726881 type:complete len:55 (+) comp23030_c0_seq3:1436-1600(+)